MERALKSIGLALAVIFALEGCLSSTTHRLTRVILERTEIENSQLTERNRIIQAERDRHQRTLQATHRKLKRLESESQALQSDLDLLIKQNEELSGKGEVKRLRE